MADIFTKNLQVVLFLAQNAGVRADSLFRDLYGFDADEVAFSKGNALDPTTSFAAANIGEFRVECRIQVGRADFFISPANPDEFVFAAEPQEPLMSIQQALDEVGRCFRQPQSAVPPLVRVAAVSAVDFPAESLLDAQTQLLDRVGMALDLDDLTSDLSFSINRKSKLGLGTMTFNRLLRFQCVMSRFVHSNPQGPQLPDAFSLNRHSLQLLIDINSIPSNMPLESSDSRRAFDEIFKELVRLAQIGNVKALQS